MKTQEPFLLAEEPRYLQTYLRNLLVTQVKKTDDQSVQDDRSHTEVMKRTDITKGTSVIPEEQIIQV